MTGMFEYDYSAWNGGAGGRTLQPFALLGVICANCKQPFPTVSPRAKFCSDACKLAHWKENKKRDAAVIALMNHFKIADVEADKLRAIVDQFAPRIYQFMTWLGYTYHPKRYSWGLV